MPELIEAIREISPMLWESALKKAHLIGMATFYGSFFGILILLLIFAILAKTSDWSLTGVEYCIMAMIIFIVFLFLVDGYIILQTPEIKALQYLLGKG